MPAPTSEQVDAILDSLRNGVSYMRSLRAAGVTLGAMAAACDVDPMLQASLREAETAGKARPPAEAPAQPVEPPPNAEQRERILEAFRQGERSVSAAIRIAGVEGKDFAAYCKTHRDFEMACDAARSEGMRRTASPAPVAPPKPVEASPATTWSEVRAASARAQEPVPVPRRARPSPIDTDVGRLKILDALREGASMADAATATGTTVDTIRGRAREDDEWAAALDDAEHEGAQRRAVEIEDEDVDLEEKEPEPPSAPKARKKKSDGEGEPRIDFEAIRQEAAEFGPGLFGLFLWQEEQLAQIDGYHRVGPWWIDETEAFLASLLRWLLVVAGRGAGKSTWMRRIVTILSLFTSRRIPPGQDWIWPFISVRPADAKRSLGEIQSILRLVYKLDEKSTKIGAPDSTPTMQTKDASGNKIFLVSFASTVGNVSGPNSIGASVDEEEKLLREGGEIVGSIAQTFRARPGVRGIRCSSVFKSDGNLLRACRKGNTITNYVARIGWKHLEAARRGLLEVALWEEQHNRDAGAAARIRALADALTADSYAAPTWLGNPSIGNPDQAPWAPERAAVATRIEAEAVDERDLDGLTKSAYWLRENASVAPDDLSYEADLGDGDPSEFGIEARHADHMTMERDYR